MVDRADGGGEELAGGGFDAHAGFEKNLCLGFGGFSLALKPWAA